MRKLYAVDLLANRAFDAGIFSSMDLAQRAIAEYWNTPLSQLVLEEANGEYGVPAWHIFAIKDRPFSIAEIECETGSEQVVVVSLCDRDKKTRNYSPGIFETIDLGLNYIKSQIKPIKEKIQVTRWGYVIGTDNTTRYFDQVPLSNSLFFLLHTFTIDEFCPFAYMSGSAIHREWPA